MPTDLLPRVENIGMNENRKQKQWSVRYQPGDAKTDANVRLIAEELNLSRVTAALLYTRGCHTTGEVTAFLHQENARLHDPFLLTDMEPALHRILEALEKKEKIMIYGDYDVDGVTSVSLLYLYLKEKGADVDYYIPCRMREGYGLSNAAINTVHETGATLMITVDTGITAVEEIRYAASLGIDTVVTDHHECRPELPEACAVVNPHRPGDAYPFRELAGVGVVFKLICAYETMECRRAGIPEEDGVRQICRKYMDLVAIGTVADVMPIVDENRLIVTVGLKLLEHNPRPGLQALMEEASGRNGDGSRKTRKINSNYIGFVLAPRMNAAGRVSSASIAVRLLLSEDRESAVALAKQLCELNATRQAEENRIAEQAYKKIEQTLRPGEDRVIVISDDSWLQGIIGIVSSRITERYGLPSILISFDGATRGYEGQDDIGKGSGRSIPGLNLVEALADSESLLVRYGGHELAAGLSVRRCNVDAFRERINQYAVAHTDSESFCLRLEADCEAEMRELTMKLAEELATLEPFGVSNPVPNLILRNAKIRKMVPISEGKHAKLLLEKDGICMPAVWFGIGSGTLPAEAGDSVDVMFQLNINEYRNAATLQMIVQDMRLSGGETEKTLQERKRYEEIRTGAEILPGEDVVPNREDVAAVYTFLRREYRMGHTVFPIRRILHAMEERADARIGYIKLKMILRMMQELQLCEYTEAGEDRYVFDFSANVQKTNLEKSSILRKLRSQLHRSGEI